MNLNQDRDANIYLDTMKKLDCITWKEVYDLLTTLPNSQATRNLIETQMKKITTPRKHNCFQLMNYFVRGEVESLINGFLMESFSFEDVLFLDTILPDFFSEIIKTLLSNQQTALARFLMDSSIQQSNDLLVKTWKQKKF